MRSYDLSPDSTYIAESRRSSSILPPNRRSRRTSRAQRCWRTLGDSVTTDHISPAGNIATKSPAGQYLLAHGVPEIDFNQYGARRGNHDVMMRGTFANIRIRNKLVPGVEGGYTLHQPTGEQMSIYDAAMKYQEAGTPLIVLAGKEYGTGSSRDWAAKGPYLLGVKAVIAESFERIHRSNLVGMGILPLQFLAGRERGEPRADRAGDVRHRGLERRRDAAQADATRARDRRGRQDEDVQGAVAHRHRRWK